ncbi:uncharacterized protein F4822DRAFT_428054 [Hypoxylon trugodes]|uniref:uncharacterized protein n=1 Tax=Hypoxylon trugodes TaxID=326681 RepID=UPI00219C27C0|nr:uncharacterized protein F4822DRAFT_428054 [Hypoxylon trugodes]KAI1389711.1 hypothetical protein F4822DRAFT_428054 [Hypoxylon trugodes]
MDSCVARQPVDGSSALVARYEFGKKAFFLISKTGSHDAWLDYFNQEIGSIWLFALPSPDASLSLTNGRSLSSSRAEPTAATNKDHDWKKLIGFGICNIGRPIQDNPTLRIIVEALQDAELLIYYLKDGRGGRHWIKKALMALQPFIREAPRARKMHEEADDLMRQCWLSNGKNTGVYGWEDEPTNRLNIVEGVFGPSIL